MNPLYKDYKLSLKETDAGTWELIKKENNQVIIVETFSTKELAKSIYSRMTGDYKFKNLSIL